MITQFINDKFNKVGLSTDKLGLSNSIVYELAIQSRYPRVIKYTVSHGLAYFGAFIGTRTFSFPVFSLVLHVTKGIDAQWRGHGVVWGQHFCQKVVLKILSKWKRKWWGIGFVKIFPRNGF